MRDPSAPAVKERPAWTEALRCEGHEFVGLIEPTYDPPSRWDPRFEPDTRARKGLLPATFYDDRQCDFHWRPVPPMAEFAAMFQQRDASRAARRTELLEQNDPMFRVSNRFHDVVRIARARCGGGQFDDIRELLRLFAELEDEIALVVLLQKKIYNRARPYQYFPELDPLFCPGHSSYPSGHSTSAHAFAYLLDAAMDVPGDPHARERARLEPIAFRIAENREIAGVHFRSDTEAGIDLARAAVNAAVAGSFAEKLAQAREMLKPR